VNSIIVSHDYKNWLTELKSKIRQSQIKASIKVNTEMLRMYWDMGHDIATKQLDAKWGSGFFNQLSRDLHKEFPEMQGFSVSNLKYIKRFYLFYSEDDTIRQQVADELGSPLFNIPWWHHVTLLTKCKTSKEALFYIQQTLANGWSRNVLLNMLDTGMYEAQGKTLTTFKKISCELAR